MRRDELAARGVQVPVLPTIALGPLPAGDGWATRLERIGLDVVSTGAAADTPATVAAARAEVPHRPLVARGGVPGDLAAAGAAIVEAPAPDGGDIYRFGAGDRWVAPVSATDAEVEAVMEVARRVLDAARRDVPSALWVAAGPGLDALDPDVVEAKLAVLVEGARQARLYLAKEQFDT